MINFANLNTWTRDSTDWVRSHENGIISITLWALGIGLLALAVIFGRTWWEQRDTHDQTSMGSALKRMIAALSFMTGSLALVFCLAAFDSHGWIALNIWDRVANRTAAIIAVYILLGYAVHFIIAFRREGWGRPMDRMETLADDDVFASLMSVTSIVVANQDSIITNVSPKFEDLIGSFPGELLGKNLTEIMPDDPIKRYRERHLAGVKHFLETGETNIMWKVVAVELLRRDGSEIPVSLVLGAEMFNGKWWFSGQMWDREETIDESTATIPEIGDDATMKAGE